VAPPKFHLNGKQLGLNNRRNVPDGSAPMPPSKLRFLVVDPLDGVQVFARRLLESFCFESTLIHCCSDPAAALAHGLLDAPDFLITDWFAKGEPTGLQLFEQLRQLHPDCKVGFMSFQITPEMEAASAGVGSRFLLKKPFGADEIKRELQRSFEHLAQKHPDLMARVSHETQGRLDPRVTRQIQLPPVPPPLRVGEHVKFEGKSHAVMAVVIRHGEQVAQLDGVKELVPAYKLTR
jgi:DNA-binding NarL/FixJ family response regulator